MRNFFEEMMHGIVKILIIGILGMMLYFFIDVFEIIDIPDQYSIVDYVYAKIQPWFEQKETQIAYQAEAAFDKENTDTTVVILDEDTKKEQEDTHLLIENIFSGNRNKSYQKDQSVSMDHLEGVYYDQLGEYAQLMYAQLYAHKEDLKSGVYNIEFDTTFNDLLHTNDGSDVLNQSFQLAVNALTFDHPEIFYIDVTKLYLLTELTTTAFSKTYRVSIGTKDGSSYLLDDFSTEEDINLAISHVEEVRALIKSSAIGNDVEKIKTIHDTLVNHITYFNENNIPSIYNIYGALVNQKSVCEGYAKSFKYILDDLGIPCVIVCGIATNSSGKTESHAWNYVQLNGKWYAVDVTWDDPVIVGNGKLTDKMMHEYFLLGSSHFFTDHTEDGNIVDNSNFVYPILNAEDY